MENEFPEGAAKLALIDQAIEHLNGYYAAYCAWRWRRRLAQ
jgi:hypothetical protein